ncbi:uncharacterized protein H6S33_011709 [Morchella sextelata]|uniref:uncharacterized protein n=1 Tax=Morchella sextelata TaxID=1174677 RepID=UPI001D04F7FF|nr:uncharacterized protein H6S33_011709 [Morchella sextelata]KAH0610182.1 hypothetical protein H6S33_011709 [Morchella sextelata]
MALADPALSHQLMLTIGKHAFADPPLPLELMLVVGEQASPRTLSVLSRTCHTLHTLLALELQRRFNADVEDITIWAAASTRPRLLERAITTALAPGSPVAAAHQDRLRDTLSRRLSRLFSLPVEQKAAETVKVLMSHKIRPFVSTAMRPRNRLPGNRPTTTTIARPPSNRPITRSRRWLIDKECAPSWVEHAVRQGDLWLARWLLEEAGAEVHASAVRVQGSQAQTLLDVARDRRFERPRAKYVEEMIQLLIKHDPKPSTPCYPGIRPENQQRLEEMLKVSDDPGALLDAWVSEELEVYVNFVWERSAECWNTHMTSASRAVGL